MTIELTEKPNKPTIIEGFPGFGFVSTIATEFLIKHLDAKKIGRISSDKLLPVSVIHNFKVIDPIEVYFAKKENLVILRPITQVTGAEWAIAELMEELADKLKAKEVIGIEGLASSEKGDKASKVFFHTNCNDAKLKKMGVECLKDGIVMGVTGVLLSKAEKIPITCIFAEANPGLPDSRAAGAVIKVLDEYLGLKVDYKPLMKTAEEVEEKLKGLMSKIKEVSEKKENKEESYLG